MDNAFNRVIKSHVKLTILSVIAVMLLTVGITYSLFQIDNKNTENQKIFVGNLDASLTSTSNTVVLSDIYPTSVSDLDGQTKYTFTISNTGDYDISYRVYLSDNTSSFLQSNTSYSSYKQFPSSSYSYMNYRLDGNSYDSLGNVQEDSKFVIMTGTLAKGKSEDHYLEFFLDNGNTTSTGAPNEVIGSLLALNINLEATATQLAPSEKTLATLGLTVKEGTPDFNTIATTDETADGLYAMEDDYGTSYYFRGAVENNYVYFAGYYWRIIRINGDGSLRIIYDGTSAHANGESSTDRQVGTSAFNSRNNDNAYVGYMYGTPGSSSYEATHANINNSTIKTYIDNWYKTNIVDKGYAEAVSDEIFCNDREVSTTDSSYTGNGTGTTKTAYKARERLYTNKSPQLTCTQKNDAFTVDDEEKGNGALTYPVGLITADEIALAGGKYLTSNSNFYLYKGSTYWSLSPYSYGSYATVFFVYNYGDLNGNSVNNAFGAVPVINLSADYCGQLEGIGSTEDPYTVR